MKALVVEDDPTIVEMVEDVLFSLDLGFDIATNQQDAKELLAVQEYDLVLLDLQIPAKANRGGADKQYGMNLLRDIQRLKKPNPPPVIMMTAHLAECLDISAELQRSGVREFVSKPFSSKGRTLSSVIQSVLESSRSSNKAFEGPMPNVASMVRETQMLETKPFQGGELVILPDRVTLCGQTVLVIPVPSKQLGFSKHSTSRRRPAPGWRRADQSLLTRPATHRAKTRSRARSEDFENPQRSYYERSLG